MDQVVTDPKIEAAAREKLVTARIGLLLRAPFFGNLATRMQLINADSWCQTAATDGRHFYYNSRFVNQLPLKQLEFLVGHEVLHAVYDHMGRRNQRDPKLWNIAGDYCINIDLVDNRVGAKIPVALYDTKYRGMSAEEEAIYDFSTELHVHRQVSDDSFKAVVERFGEQGVMDLIAVNGYYTLIAMVLNVDRTPVPGGAPLPLK